MSLLHWFGWLLSTTWRIIVKPFSYLSVLHLREMSFFHIHTPDRIKLHGRYLKGFSQIFATACTMQITMIYWLVQNKNFSQYQQPGLDTSSALSGVARKFCQWRHKYNGGGNQGKGASGGIRTRSLNW